MATAKLPDGFHEALAREVKFSPLQSRPAQGRRSITNENWHDKDERTEFQKMSDKALVTQGMAIQRQWENVDEVKRHVIAAYGNGNSALNSAQIAAVVAIAWSMQLDPSPGAGHLYVWTKGNNLIISPGYQGYLFKAQQQYQIYYEPARPMTQEERELHALAAADVGAVCELYEMGRARMAKELGLPIKPIVGVAVWKKDDNVAKSKTPFWMASKNAIKDAIRQLGLGFNTMQIPEVDGFYYDRETDAFIEVTPSAPPPAPEPLDTKALEGEIFQAMAASRVDANANEESDLTEPTETPDHTTEVKTDIVEPGETVTSAPVESAPKPDRPYPPAQINAKFKQALNKVVDTKRADPKVAATLDKAIETFDGIVEIEPAKAFVLHVVGSPEINAAHVAAFGVMVKGVADEVVEQEVMGYLKSYGLLKDAPASEAAEGK